MTKARRAQPRPARVVIPIIVVVAALAAVGVVWRMGSDTGTASPGRTASSASVSAPTDQPSASAAASTGQTASAEPSSTPSGSSGPAASSAAATKALKRCQSKVSAGDDVVEAASTGVKHWSEHVQAQTDDFDQKITDTEMSAIFARTRLAGPDDVTRYDDATKAWDDADGTCATRDDASAADNSQLAFCSQRLTAMKPVLTAGQDGMDDWEHHLSDMRHSRMVHVDDAEQIWLDAWKAAPPHIKAFAKAKDAYADAPDC